MNIPRWHPQSPRSTSSVRSFITWNLTFRTVLYHKMVVSLSLVCARLSGYYCCTYLFAFGDWPGGVEKKIRYRMPDVRLRVLIAGIANTYSYMHCVSIFRAHYGAFRKDNNTFHDTISWTRGLRQSSVAFVLACKLGLLFLWCALNRAVSVPGLTQSSRIQSFSSLTLQVPNCPSERTSSTGVSFYKSCLFWQFHIHSSYRLNA